MNIWKRRNNLRVIFVVAFALIYFAFSNIGILFAAAPTVTTGAASSITKTTATLAGTVTDDGGEIISTVGFEYGLTTSYGSTTSGNPNYALEIDFGSVGSSEGAFGSGFAFGVDVDSSGNLYAVDTINDRIQIFDSDGVFVTMFGWGVDTGANSFETCTSGCQAGIAGSGNGQFNNPSGIAVDSSGNIYVSDSNNRIQKFNSSYVFQLSFGSSGTLESQFDSPTEIDVSGVSNNLYITDTNNNRVQVFSSSGVFVTMFGWGVDTGANSFETCTSGCQAGIAGSGNGQFNIPLGIAVDSSGNIYVTNDTNKYIQKFNSSNTFVAKTSDNEQVVLSNFGSPEGVAINQDDEPVILYHNGSAGAPIVFFDSSLVYQTTFSLADVKGFSTGIAIDSVDSIFATYNYDYVGDVTDAGIQKFALSSISRNLTGLTCGTTYHYRAFATNADGTSYGSDATFDTIACEVPTVVTKAATQIRKTAVVLNGLQTSDGVSASTVRGYEYGTTTAYGSTINSSLGNSLSASSSGSNGITEFNFSSIAGVGRDASGNIYVADSGNNRIVKLDSTGGFLSMFGWGVDTGANAFETCTTDCEAGISGSGNGQFNAPQDVAVNLSNGDIYVSDTGNNRVQIFNSSHDYGSQFGSAGSGSGQFSSPKGIEVYSGSVYIVDSGNNRVQKFNASGTVLAESAGLNSPSGLVVSDDGYIYVTNTGNDEIHYLNTTLNANGNVSFNVPTGWTTMDSPTGIGIDSDFGLYITDSVNDRIMYATRDSFDEYTFVSAYGSNGTSLGQFDTPKDILFDSDTSKLYVVDSANDRLQIVSPFFYRELKPISCGTTYHYRAYATNADGTAYGDDVMFTTLNCSSTTGSSGGGGPGPDPEGCTDIYATNFDSNAVIDDGSCIYDVYGCIDYTATNYNSLATIDDGSCVYGPTPILGCTNPSATNYNPSANQNDGSCEFSTTGDPDPDDVLGCTDTFATNYNEDATFDDGSCEYELITSFISGCTNPIATNYNPFANQDDGTCDFTEDPPLPPIITEIIEFIEENEEEIVQVSNVVAPLGLVIPGLFYLLLQRAPLAYLISIPIRLWNLIPVLLGLRRRRRPWGTVYDSVTKQPLDPVYLTLKNTEGEEVGQSITDIDGRYGFWASLGIYTILPKKTDYVFPSQKLFGKSNDYLYDNLYFGGEIKVENEDEIINKNIPMDAINFNWNEFEKTKNKKLMKFFSKTELFMSRIAKSIFIAGFIASILLSYLEPRILNHIVLGIYVLILILSIFGIKPRKPGFAIERESGVPLSFAILTVFSAVLQKEIAHTIVGKTGRYHVLVPKGNYYVKIKKKTGEDSYEEIYTSDVFKVKKGYIDKVIKV